MKISCLPVSLFGKITNGNMSIADWAQSAKALGYDGIDISIMFLKNRTPTYLNQLKKELSKIGIPIVMMTTYTDFSHPEVIQRHREFDYLVHDIALCSEIGIPYLRILAGQAHPETSITDGVDLVIENFKRADLAAKEYGVMLLYEDHAKPGAWDRVDFSFSPQVFLKICEGIRDTDIRINFDTGNIVAYGENPMDILPKVIDKVETIHLTDMREVGKFSPVVIGTGVVPNREVFRYLRQHGFNGWICIEKASNTGLAGIQTARNFVIEAWGAEA